jgi:hypothetical protein
MLASQEEAVVRFSCKLARPPPQANRALDLHWLVQLFAQRLGAPNSELNVVASIHCTWSKPVNVHAGWQQPVALAAGAYHRECNWGPDMDPVTRLELATTSQVTLPKGTASIAGHQQLDARGNTVPEMCPRWSLLVERERDDPKQRKTQAPLAGLFQQLIDSLSEAEGVRFLSLSLSCCFSVSPCLNSLCNQSGFSLSLFLMLLFHIFMPKQSMQSAPSGTLRTIARCSSP